MINACHCGRPSPDAFLCKTCTTELRQALTDLGRYLPELETTITRQHRTTGAPPRRPAAQPATALPPTELLPAFLRTPSTNIALTATRDAVSFQTADLLAEARTKLIGWVRHLTESRGLDTPNLGRSAR